jgi:gas vesicle protein
MNDNAKVLLAAIAGAAVGIVAGILIAPASGKETLEDLNKKADALKKDMEELSEKSKKSINEMSDTLSNSITKTFNGLKKDAIGKE